VYVITELSHLLLMVQETKFPYAGSYLRLCHSKVLIIAMKKRLANLFPMIVIINHGICELITRSTVTEAQLESDDRG